MWTMTTRGFFSAVQHRDDADLLVVRTRDHGDAATLQTWYATWSQAQVDADTDMAAYLPPAIITSYPMSDYPWRVILPRQAWAEFLVEVTADLDYGNFKDAVKAAQGPARAGVYMEVWGAMLRLERLDPLGRRYPEPDWDDEPWGDYDAWEADQAVADLEDDCPDFSDLDLSHLPTSFDVSRYLERNDPR